MPPQPPPPPHEVLVHQRRLGFLLWHFTFTLLTFIVTLPLSSTNTTPLSFLSFHSSSLIFSLSLTLLSSPHPLPHAPVLSLLSDLFWALLKLLVGGFHRGPLLEASLRHRAARTLAIVAFLVACGVSSCFGLAALCGGQFSWVVAGIGVRGFGVGLLYGAWYVYRRRWLLTFPIVQRPLFFSFKMGLLTSFQQTIKLLTPAIVFSILLRVFLPNYMKTKATFRQFLLREIHVCIGISVILFCWEVGHNLLQVVNTRRFNFAPSQGSAAAETNPSVPLLECLEQCSPRSLVQYLAYLDLCIVTESNAEPWRRAAFFEETGETYRRVIATCLRPLEKLTSNIGHVLEVYSDGKTGLSSTQVTPVTDHQIDCMLHEAFCHFQLCSWSARAAATLTARSHSEDRFGVAQLSGCNAAVITNLLMCLLAVEACMGKKTSLQPVQFLGAGRIRWATPNTGRSAGLGTTVPRRRSASLQSKAYAMADVLRSSVYEIVTTFEADMHANVKASVLERNWIAEGKPLYGSKPILVQKLLLFLEFQAS